MMKKPRHVPIRTCVACRATDEKRDLLRVVRQPDGAVLYDPNGKLSGRGAYICASASCIAQARKQKRLERSLKVSGVPEELFNALSARAASLGEESRPMETTAVSSAGVLLETRAERAVETPQESEVEII